ncbi:MAG: hypothetical protein ACYC06_08145 [Ilumatobacteraceae bacterium]
MVFALRRDFVCRLLIITGLTAISAACGTGASNNTIDAVAPAANNSSAPTASNPSIDFTASLLDGSPIMLHEQLAQQPVALWFWAPG